MANKLKQLKLTAVALCKQGANPDAHIMLYKSINEGGKSMGFEEILKSLPEDQQAIIKAEMKAKEDMAAENKKKMEEAQSQCKSLETEIETLKSKSSTTEEHDMFKNVPESVKKAFDAMQAKVAEAEKLAKSLQDTQIKKSFVEKADIFKALPTKANDIGEMLYEVSKSDAKLSDKLFDMFKAADELIQSGAHFKEVGVTTTKSAGSATVKLEKHAQDIAKSNIGLTKEQAFAKAIEMYPELYVAYLQEEVLV